MTELTRDVVTVLALAAALSGLVLFAVAVAGLLLATFRVGILGRVLVTPFRGGSGSAELTHLFMQRLLDIEAQWTALAREISRLKEGFDKKSRVDRSTYSPQSPTGCGFASPLVDGEPLRAMAALRDDGADLGTAPRTLGDDFMRDVLVLDEAGSVAGADIGAVSVAGVSFSPHQVLAVLRRVPGVSARRLISGRIVAAGKVTVLTVTYEERSLHRRSQHARSSVEASDDTWTASLDRLAFNLAKERIHLLRDRSRSRRERRREPLRSSGSRTADRTVVEAETWTACEAFLRGYASHLDHYVSGKAADRERALAHYGHALAAQPGYARAAYNRATLLYNRYVPTANREAIELFETATNSADPHDGALAFAGLTMAYCQGVHRFGEPAEELVPKALQASKQAIELGAQLEEACFARAWANQIRGARDEALAGYEAVHESSASPSHPGRRIVSFARNNAAWLLLERADGDVDVLRQAEALLWEAISLYPNKIAYANLAEIARQRDRYDDAMALLKAAVDLDASYVNGWNERACLELALARQAAARSDDAAARDYVDDARADNARALALAQDDGAYAAKLKGAFAAALEANGFAGPAKAPARESGPPLCADPWRSLKTGDAAPA